MSTVPPSCTNCGGSDFVWVNDLKTGSIGGGSLSIRSRGELSLGTRICRGCGHADLFLKDPSILRMPHTWRPGEFVPIVPRPAAPPPPAPITPAAPPALLATPTTPAPPPAAPEAPPPFSAAPPVVAEEPTAVAPPPTEPALSTDARAAPEYPATSPADETPRKKSPRRRASKAKGADPTDEA